MTGKFQLFQGKDKKHDFRGKATNGQVVGTSESYSSGAACTNGLESVAKNAPMGGGCRSGGHGRRWTRRRP